MRLIGHLENEARALQISSVLLSQGIANQVESDEGVAHAWAVWVLAEDDLERAAGILAAFRANPDDPRFGLSLGLGARGRGGAGARGGEEPAVARSPARAEGASSSSPRPARREAVAVAEGGIRSRVGGGEVTIFVLMVCAVLGVVTGLKDDHAVVRQLQISEVLSHYGRAWRDFLPEVRTGQIWRLFTPALLHFGFPHLLFNLWTFWDLGRAIEWRRGSGTLAGLILGLGVLSNLGQYVAVGPNFGGLSGVIYGLLGYVWMLGRYRPSAGLALHPQMVVMMLVWFVICLTGLLGVPVANMAHGVGLVAGMVWGWIAARWGR